MQNLLARVVASMGFLGMVLTEPRELLAGRSNPKQSPTVSVVGAACSSAGVCPSAASLWHSSVLLKGNVLLNRCALRAVAALPRKERVCICTEREPGISSIFGTAAEVS